MKTPFQSPQYVTVDALKGESVVAVVVSDDEVVVTTLNAQFRFFHEQDCCESVSVTKVTGWPEVKDSEVIEAKEEITSPDREDGESETDSKYTLTTPTGALVILFNGVSKWVLQRDSNNNKIMKITITKHHYDLAVAVPWSTTTCIVAQAVMEATGEGIAALGASGGGMLNDNWNTKFLVIGGSVLQAKFDFHHSGSQEVPQSEVLELLPLEVEVELA